MRITSTTQVEPDQHPDPADQDVEHRRAARRRVRRPTRARSAIQVNDRNGAGVPGVTVTHHRPGDDQQPHELGRLRDLRLRADRRRYTARVNTAGWVDTRRQPERHRRRDRHPGQRQRRLDHLRPAASVVATFDTEARDGTTPLIVPARRRSSRPRTPACPRARSLRSRGCATTTRAGGAMLPTITATGLFPFADGYGMLRRRLPRRRPDDQRLRLLHDLPRRVHQTSSPGQASARRSSSGCPRSTCACSTTAPRRRRRPATRRPASWSSRRAPDCSEVFDFPAPATESDPHRLMANSALPFGNYTVASSRRTPGSTSSHALEGAHRRQELVPQGHEAAGRRQSGGRPVQRHDAARTRVRCA